MRLFFRHSPASPDQGHEAARIRHSTSRIHERALGVHDDDDDDDEDDNDDDADDDYVFRFRKVTLSLAAFQEGERPFLFYEY